MIDLGRKSSNWPCCGLEKHHESTSSALHRETDPTLLSRSVFLERISLEN